MSRVSKTEQLEIILDCLENVRPGNGRWSARCPLHDDRKNSLSLTIGRDRRVLLMCFAGCKTAEVLREIGLTFRDLSPKGQPRRSNGWPTKKTTKPTQYAWRRRGTSLAPVGVRSIDHDIILLSPETLLTLFRSERLVGDAMEDGRRAVNAYRQGGSAALRDLLNQIRHEERVAPMSSTDGRDS